MYAWSPSVRQSIGRVLACGSNKNIVRPRDLETRNDGLRIARKGRMFFLVETHDWIGPSEIRAARRNCKRKKQRDNCRLYSVEE